MDLTSEPASPEHAGGAAEGLAPGPAALAPAGTGMQTPPASRCDAQDQVTATGHASSQTRQECGVASAPAMQPRQLFPGAMRAGLGPMSHEIIKARAVHR